MTQVAARAPYERSEIIGGGTRATGSTPGRFVQNMYFFEGAWHLRKGFGQMAEFDTTMAQAADVSTDELRGYVKQLGSFFTRTNFGHDQIITVFLAQCHTGSWRKDTQEDQARGSMRDLYVVNIYDVTTNQRHEEVLYKRTSDLGQHGFMPEAHGCYASNFTDVYESWINGIDEEFYFTELNDVVYFGAPVAGLWAYRPSIFRSDQTATTYFPRSTQLEAIDTRQSCIGYEESPVVIQVVASDGALSDAFIYLTDAELPKPQLVTTIQGRLASRELRSRPCTSSTGTCTSSPRTRPTSTARSTIC
jgi:hypothetical protein